MSDERVDWEEFVYEVQARANHPEHGYQAILIVGMRVVDGVVQLYGGASPPTLRQTSGEALTPEQLERWRDAMVASATQAVDRVVQTMTCAHQARARGLLQ